MDYACKTIKLLLEKNPEYLQKILIDLKCDISLENTTPEEIYKKLSFHNETKKIHESKLYTCECGSKYVTNQEYQLRSADEGSTIIFTCHECHKVWQ